MIQVGDGGLSQKQMIRFDVNLPGLVAAGVLPPNAVIIRPGSSVQVYDGGLEKVGPGRQRLRDALLKHLPSDDKMSETEWDLTCARLKIEP